MRLTQLWPAAATAVLLSSALGLQANGVDTATAVPQLSVDGFFGTLYGLPHNTTGRVVLTGTNFTSSTKLIFEPPTSLVTFRVVSPTRIVLFLKIRQSFATMDREPLKIVALDTGAGAVQIHPENGGLVIGRVWTHAEDSDEQVDTAVRPPPVVNPSSEALNRWSGMPLWVHGADFNMAYTELYFNPPLPEESIKRYEVSRPDLVSIVVNHQDLDPGPIRVVAIDTGSGLVHLNPEDGGIVVSMVLSSLEGGDVAVKDDESVLIYQSSKRFQITGSGFKDNTKVLLMYGLCGGETSSIIHTNVGERPDQLTLELAEGYTWYDKDPVYLPLPLELKSIDAGEGWTQLGPADAPAKSPIVAIVFQDPSIDASDKEIYRGSTMGLEIHGAGFLHHGSVKQRDWVYHTVPPILVFDPPIDPDLVEVFFENSNRVTVAFQQVDAPQWAPAGYFGPLKVKGVDTGAGMVMLEPPVTVANIVPGSPYDFFLVKRIHEEGGALRHHQDRVDQAAREWQAMTLAEQTQAAGTLVPTPSVEASSQEIFARQDYDFVVVGANFSPESKLLFDPPLHEHESFQHHFISGIRIQFFCMEPTCYLAQPGPLKVVAIDTGAGLVRLNPEGGGIVVATVKPNIEVQQDEELLVYQSTKQIRIAGSGFEHVTEVRVQEGLHEEEAEFTITDTKPDQLTLTLAEGDAWVKDPSSLPRALLVSGVKARPGSVFFYFASVLPGRKVATVFEDPSIQASDAEIFRGFTRELSIYGAGFNNVVQPILVFAPPLDDGAVNVHVVNRTMICLTLSATRADWTKAEDYLGPLKIEGVDTGAGMVVFDSPITVATVLPGAGTHDDRVSQVATNTDALPSPSVEASSGELFMGMEANGIILTGSNFSLRPKLYFDSALPENVQQQFLSSTEIAVTKDFSSDRFFDIPPGPRVPNPWRAEAGPLKIVAIDTGAGRVELNPEGGGVVVATVLADVSVQPNEDLHVYQSTTQIQVSGSGFDNDIQLEFLGFLGVRGERADAVTVDALSDNQIDIELAEGSVWVKDPGVLPGPLWMECNIGVAGFKSQVVSSSGYSLSFGGPVATVFEDPSIDASDIEINRTGSQELVIWGTGFNDMVPPAIDFDPPLDVAKFHVNVVNRTTIQLALDATQSGWVPEEQLGPLKIKGVDTGAGMVVFDSPVTVATVVPDSKPLFNKGLDVDLDVLKLGSRESTTPFVHEAMKAADLETEGYSEQIDNTAVSPPSVEASSTVISMGATDSLVVRGDNFKLGTRLIFDPPLDKGFDMRVFSQTEIDIFTKYVIGEAPSKWRAAPGPLKVVAVDTGAGVVQLNPGDGGVVVAMVR